MPSTTITKPFKTYDEQLTILKGRGMQIEDENIALQTLKSENYYRLSGYWLTMQLRAEDGTESFYPGTSFGDVVCLYKFDSQLRNVILSATTVIETNLKAFVAYRHAQQHGPCGYLDNHHFEDPWNHAAFLNALSADFRKRKNEDFVIHHEKDLHSVFPIWVVTEVCSFDQISKFFKNMLPADRQYIARNYYGISSREYIESWLQCAVVARNMAAHGARFYNRKRLKPEVKLPKHLQQYRASLFGYIYALYWLLPAANREKFLDDIALCVENHDYVLIRHLSFPNGWREVIRMGNAKTAIPSYPDEVRAAVARYLAYGWEWRVISKMVNRVYGYSYTSEELQKLHT